MKKIYYEVRISAENPLQAEKILRSLLTKKLITHGQILKGSMSALWKSEIVSMPEYVTIYGFTTESKKDLLKTDVKKNSAEDLPMITFNAPEDLNEDLITYIDRELG